MAIALLTDFGTRDYFVGAMKGAILSIDPQATFVDITHEIERHNIAEAAFTLAACDLDFPLRTIFLCVVDPGVGSARRPMVVEALDRLYVAPDNGLLTHVLSRDGQYVAFELKDPAFTAPIVSRTFHGRDIFAPAAGHLSLGVAASKFGPPIAGPVLLSTRSPTAGSAQIIQVDHFGNLITDLRSRDVKAPLTGELNGHAIAGLQDSYSTAPTGTLFFVHGSSGFVEVSMREASAADVTRAKIGNIVKLPK